MAWSPYVTVAAVIRDASRYLMVEEQPQGARVINQPAGHLEPGESLLDAIRREVLEETCRVFEPTGLLGVYRWQLHGREKQETYLRFCFGGSVGGPLPDSRRDPDILDTPWLTLEEIRAGLLRPRSPLVLRCIEDALHRSPLPLEVLQEVDDGPW